MYPTPLVVLCPPMWGLLYCLLPGRSVYCRIASRFVSLVGSDCRLPFQQKGSDLHIFLVGLSGRGKRGVRRLRLTRLLLHDLWG